MVIPANGAVVLVRFPFSDLSNTKVRPAIVLAETGRDDWLLCQITSQRYTDPKAIEITKSDFASGLLKKTSYVRPGKLFTANSQIMTKHIGDLERAKLEEIIKAVISLLQKSL